jgi:16S rRNA (adenine1518-N6/adenine1519-N6)-dimethyltransferase
VPKKQLGQHFLSDRRILEQIVEFARVGANDTVVEIGPGRGTLTSALAARVGHVIAIELDRDLIGGLRRSAASNVEILEDDALQVDFTQLCSTPYHIVGNLPYNIATVLVGMFLKARRSILAATLMLQKEVAERILAHPGSRQYGALSVAVQYCASVEAGFTVGSGAFTPQPKVQSQLIRLTWRPGVPDAPELMRLVRQAFSSRRKKLINNLAPGFPGIGRKEWVALLEQLHIDPDARAENLSVDDFLHLHQKLGSDPYVPI